MPLPGKTVQGQGVYGADRISLIYPGVIVHVKTGSHIPNDTVSVIPVSLIHHPVSVIRNRLAKVRGHTCGLLQMAAVGGRAQVIVLQICVNLCNTPGRRAAHIDQPVQGAPAVRTVCNPSGKIRPSAAASSILHAMVIRPVVPALDAPAVGMGHPPLPHGHCAAALIGIGVFPCAGGSQRGWNSCAEAVLNIVPTAVEAVPRSLAQRTVRGPGPAVR